MRVQANSRPAAMTAEPYGPRPGYMEIRLRENVRRMPETDGESGEPVSMYQYDEYVLRLPAREGLEQEIGANLPDWLTTGRSLETDMQATALREQGDRISALVTEGAALAQASTEEPSPTVGVLADGFQAWEAGMYYEKLYSLFTYDGKVGFTRQAGLTAQAHYPPFSTGTEAVYGVRPVPDDAGVYPYVRNMAASNGMRVRSAKDGAVYVAIQAADPLLYDPADVPALFTKEDDL